MLLPFLQMLSSLAHAQQLATKAVSEARAGLSSAAAASASTAAGAAAMLGRGLARAATRARTSAGGAAAPAGASASLDAADASPGLLLHPTALFTIREYGWAEVMTLFPTEADAGGMLEMEAHDLASGTAALYSRPAVGEPWTMVSVGWVGESCQVDGMRVGRSGWVHASAGRRAW
jgi:hypothetical protein